MFTLPANLKAKGDRAEAAFADWLDRSVVPYIYIEQSPFTLPAALKGRIKRPDYLVGLPHVGLLAFDVKAKSTYKGMLLFDQAEVEKLALFARLFNLTLYFVCIDEADGNLHRWVPLGDLILLPTRQHNRRSVVPYPADKAHPADITALPFLDMLIQVAESAIDGP